MLDASLYRCIASGDAVAALRSMRGRGAAGGDGAARAVQAELVLQVQQLVVAQLKAAQQH